MRAAGDAAWKAKWWLGTCRRWPCY
jgi:hypothetical protein